MQFTNASRFSRLSKQLVHSSKLVEASLSCAELSKAQPQLVWTFSQPRMIVSILSFAWCQASWDTSLQSLLQVLQTKYLGIRGLAYFWGHMNYKSRLLVKISYCQAQAPAELSYISASAPPSHTPLPGKSSRLKLSPSSSPRLMSSPLVPVSAWPKPQPT